MSKVVCSAFAVGLVLGLSAYGTYDEPTGTSGRGNVGHGRAGYRLGLAGPGNPRAGQSVPDDTQIPSNVASDPQAGYYVPGNAPPTVGSQPYYVSPGPGPERQPMTSNGNQYTAPSSSVWRSDGPPNMGNNGSFNPAASSVPGAGQYYAPGNSVGGQYSQNSTGAPNKAAPMIGANGSLYTGSSAPAGNSSNTRHVFVAPDGARYFQDPVTGQFSPVDAQYVPPSGGGQSYGYSPGQRPIQQNVYGQPIAPSVPGGGNAYNGSVNTAGRPYVLTGPDGRTYVHDSSNGNLIPYNP